MFEITYYVNWAGQRITMSGAERVIQPMGVEVWGEGREGGVGDDPREIFALLYYRKYPYKFQREIYMHWPYMLAPC
jgi:hypothetical protein